MSDTFIKVNHLSKQYSKRKVVSDVSLKVKKGEVIGLVGDANNEEGPHLHFEIWHNNLIIDPRNLIKDYKINDVSIKE